MADWLPGTRELQLNMAKVWLDTLKNKGEAWKIDQTLMMDMTVAIQNAENILQNAMNTSRNQIITTECQRHFGELQRLMRFLKDRYFKAPPLMDEDFTKLLLKVPDTSKRPRGEPKAQKTAEFKRSGVNMLILAYHYAEGTEHLASAHNDVRLQVRYGVLPPPGIAPVRLELGQPPVVPIELPEAFDTARKTDIINFPVGTSGKTAYFAFRIHNGKTGYGPWSPIISTVVP